jgi:hypothetical protein
MTQLVCGKAVGQPAEDDHDRVLLREPSVLARQYRPAMDILC